MGRQLGAGWSRRDFLRGASVSALALGTKGVPGALSSPVQNTVNLQDQVVSLRPLDTAIAQQCVLDDVQLRFRSALEKVKHARTADEARAAQSLLRRNLGHSLGMHRFRWPPDLQPRLVGTLQRQEFRIEKIIYQTFPGSYVPALLYVPNGLHKPVPGIIFYIGHWWKDAKAGHDEQALCINLARMGFVVLTWDPFGEGERGISSRDHRRDGALLVGISEQGYAEYETQCALKYLLSRPEVDPGRIGMTGASGGGYNSWVTSVLDDRIKVIVPVVGTSEFYEQLWSMRYPNWFGSKDHCHHVAGLVCYADNYEFLASVAPRPLCMIAASDDSGFPADGVLKIYEYGRELYGSFGTPGNIRVFVDATAGHGYQVKKREAAYGWFLRWLMGKGEGAPEPEPPTQTLPPDSPDLRCFTENRSSGPMMVSVAVEALAALRPSASPPGDLERLFGSTPSFVRTDSWNHALRDKCGVQRLEVLSENGIVVPAFLAKADTSVVKGVIIGVDDRGKESLIQDAFIQLAIKDGWALCGVDPRGIGELAIERMEWASAASLLMNENFVWRQGWDLRCACRSLHAANANAGASTPLVVYGRGDNSALAVTYAIAQQSGDSGSEVHAFILRDGFVSFRQFLDRPQSLAMSYRLQPNVEDDARPAAYDREIPYQYFVFDVLSSLDLPQLMGSAKGRGLVVNPLDGNWQQMSESVARKYLPSSIELLCENSPEREMLGFLGG